MARKKIGAMLEEKGIITEFQLYAALSYQRKWKTKLGESLIELGYLEEDQLYEVLAEQLEMEFVDLRRLEIPHELLKKINKDFVREWLAMPIEFDGSQYVVACSEPERPNLSQSLANVLGAPATLKLATPTSIEVKLRKVPERTPVGAVQPVKKAFVRDQNGDIQPVEHEPAAAVVSYVNTGESIDIVDDELVSVDDDLALPDEDFALPDELAEPEAAPLEEEINVEIPLDVSELESLEAPPSPGVIEEVVSLEGDDLGLSLEEDDQAPGLAEEMPPMEELPLMEEAPPMEEAPSFESGPVIEAPDLPPFDEPAEPEEAAAPIDDPGQGLDLVEDEDVLESELVDTLEAPPLEIPDQGEELPPDLPPPGLVTEETPAESAMDLVEAETAPPLEEVPPPEATFDGSLGEEVPGLMVEESPGSIEEEPAPEPEQEEEPPESWLESAHESAAEITAQESSDDQVDMMDLDEVFPSATDGPEAEEAAPIPMEMQTEAIGLDPAPLQAPPDDDADLEDTLPIIPPAPDAGEGPGTFDPSPAEAPYEAPPLEAPPLDEILEAPELELPSQEGPAEASPPADLEPPDLDMLTDEVSVEEGPPEVLVPPPPDASAQEEPEYIDPPTLIDRTAQEEDETVAELERILEAPEEPEGSESIETSEETPDFAEPSLSTTLDELLNSAAESDEGPPVSSEEPEAEETSGSLTLDELLEASQSEVQIEPDEGALSVPSFNLAEPEPPDDVPAGEREAAPPGPSEETELAEPSSGPEAPAEEEEPAPEVEAAISDDAPPSELSEEEEREILQAAEDEDTKELMERINQIENQVQGMASVLDGLKDMLKERQGKKDKK